MHRLSLLSVRSFAVAFFFLVFPQLAQAANFIIPVYPTTTQAGQTTASLTMEVTEAPITGVSITPNGPGLTFTPSTISFDSSETAKSFTVTAAANAGPGPITVNYALSGPGAGSYLWPDSGDFIVLGVFTPPTYPTLAKGATSSSLTVTASAAPPTEVTLTPSGTGVTFTPPTITFGAGAITGTFTVTASPTADAGLTSISYAVGGPDSAKYAAPSSSILTITGPTVTWVTPSSGTTDGGTSVHINGANFTGATSVTFGGTAATSFVVDADSQITAVAPAHVAGAVDVAVTTPDGTATRIGGYTYVTPAAPTLTSLTPAIGTTQGGAPVYLTGANFTGTTAVTFGGSPATSFTVYSDSFIGAFPPAHADGAVDVVVTNPSGTATLTNSYTYTSAPPTLSGLSPDTVTEFSSPTVTISGTNLLLTTAVMFGGTPVNFVVDSDTQIFANAPGLPAGVRDVAVTTPNGTATLVSAFTHLPSPTIVGIAPNSGTTMGGASIIITGTNLTLVTTVRFGDSHFGPPATSLTVDSDTQITAVTPAHAAGAVDVSLSAGGFPVTLASGYTFVTPAPTVTDLSPTSGPEAGGTAVTITGTSFSGATAVTFDGTPATSFTVNSDSQITATAPAHGAGAVDVAVTTANGTGTLTSGYTYVATSSPTADAGPDQPGVSQGSSVTLDGSASSDPNNDPLTYSWVQTAGPAVTLTGANTAAPSFTAPAGPAALTFELTVSDGAFTDTDTVAVTVATSSPTADAGPDQTGVSQGSSVTLDGSASSDPNNDPLTYSWVQTAGPAVTLVGANTAAPSFTAPAGPAALSFELTVDDGAFTDTDTVTVTVATSSPTADAGPDQPGVSQGSSVTLNGSASSDPNNDPLTYSWVQTAGPAVTITGATTATPSFTAPAGPAALTFELTVDDGASTDTDTVTITVATSSPTADAGPDQPGVSQGSTVTLDGSASTDPDNDPLTYSWVQTAGPAVTLVGANTANPTFTAPASGTLTFELTVDDGASTDTDTVTITVAPVAPTISSLSPTSGPTAGGTVVTITGANFLGTLEVTFDGLPALWVSTPTQITATAPAHLAAGVVDVVVTTFSGTATRADSYTYIGAATDLSISSSINPSELGESVTFTASLSSSGGTPTGTITFYDGAAVLGAGTLSSGQATFTTSVLGLGSHSISASYPGGGGFEGSTSPVLIQNVDTPEDSVNLRALQLMATRVVSQNSGAAISGAVSGAISDGFAADATGFQINADGVHLAFSAGDAPQPAAAATLPAGISAFAEDAGNSRIDRAFGMANPGAEPSPGDAVAQPWRLWADVSVSGIPDDDDEASNLEGTQVNAITGATYKFTPNFLAGVLIGYEAFDYDSDTLNGELDGDGLTIGSYLGWKLAPGLRFDAAAAYSAMDYSATSGAASGSFDADRWLVSGGLTGNFKAGAFEIEPTSNLYVLWEDQSAYVDSLDILQPGRSTFAGRASAGFKVGYPTQATDVMLTPYAGIYADYYANGDDAIIAPAPGFDSANVPFDDGLSGRVTFGVGARLPNGASLSLGGELGGLGQDVQAWSGEARISKSF